MISLSCQVSDENIGGGEGDFFRDRVPDGPFCLSVGYGLSTIVSGIVLELVGVSSVAQEWVAVAVAHSSCQSRASSLCARASGRWSRLAFLRTTASAGSSTSLRVETGCIIVRSLSWSATRFRGLSDPEAAGRSGGGVEGLSGASGATWWSGSRLRFGDGLRADRVVGGISELGADCG